LKACAAADSAPPRAAAVVAVVDPPRGGLHPSVLKALRRCAAIDSLVYVSCNPATLLQDMQKLTQAASAKFPGAPFAPVRALCVDMFPHTEHCELIVQLRRQKK
jgi:tRNA (uracil-5-)-methyltransferase